MAAAKRVASRGRTRPGQSLREIKMGGTKALAGLLLAAAVFALATSPDRTAVADSDVNGPLTLVKNLGGTVEESRDPQRPGLAVRLFKTRVRDAHLKDIGRLPLVELDLS